MGINLKIVTVKCLRLRVRFFFFGIYLIRISLMCAVFTVYTYYLLIMCWFYLRLCIICHLLVSLLLYHVLRELHAKLH